MRHLRPSLVALALSLTALSFTALTFSPLTSHADASLWHENFVQFPADWGSPRQNASEIRAVYRVASEGGDHFLHADHDGTSKIPAVHVGRAFRSPELPLRSACRLSWKWRVLEHPKVGEDAWLDLGASVYVVTKNPGLFGSGRGFKFGWLSKPGARGKDQRGIRQLELRHSPATRQFETESVDLCALYEQHFGPVGDEKLLYVGVVSDADNTKSRARADYADFRLTAH
ncbi:MAG TPA: hypothetical protein VLC09_13805 [Polyangiaceae bacterium]|nr:hypothetical protein [Polyangiaceae bacterium]